MAVAGRQSQDANQENDGEIMNVRFTDNSLIIHCPCRTQPVLMRLSACSKIFAVIFAVIGRISEKAVN